MADKALDLETGSIPHPASYILHKGLKAYAMSSNETQTREENKKMFLSPKSVWQ